jgi:hypothetical protein
VTSTDLIALPLFSSLSMFPPACFRLRKAPGRTRARRRRAPLPRARASNTSAPPCPRKRFSTLQRSTLASRSRGSARHDLSALAVSPCGDVLPRIATHSARYNSVLRRQMLGALASRNIRARNALRRRLSCTSFALYDDRPLSAAASPIPKSVIPRALYHPPHSPCFAWACRNLVSGGAYRLSPALTTTALGLTLIHCGPRYAGVP